MVAGDMGKIIRVCSLEDLPPGRKIRVDVDGHRILVVNIDGKTYAVDAICTHQYADLGNGFLMDRIITCPLHLSRFDLTSGRPLNPPATNPLRTYPTHVKDGSIYVEV